MTEWMLNVTYGITPYKLRAVIEYESSQIMRIRVHGKTSSILLENNYPLLRFSKAKSKAIQWKLREGSFKSDDPKKDTNFLYGIMAELEHEIKQQFPIY